MTAPKPIRCCVTGGRAVISPRDRLELRVLEATGDPETAERAGMLAALVVEVHAEVIAEIVGVPAETFVNEFWGAVL